MALAALVEAAPTTVVAPEVAPAREWAAPAALALSSASSPFSTSAAARSHNYALRKSLPDSASAQIGSPNRAQAARK